MAGVFAGRPSRCLRPCSRTAMDRAGSHRLPSASRSMGIVLAQMAAANEIRRARDALRSLVRKTVPPPLEEQVRAWCLRAQLRPDAAPDALKGNSWDPKLLTALRYPTVQVMLAAEKVVEH